MTSIGRRAFEDCASLTSITLPEGVTRIGSYAFWGCESLTAITLPEGVTSIGYMAFCGCANLTNITLPEGVTSIGDAAFKGCKSLTDVVVPKGVTSIGDEAFCDCESLTSITLPDGVTEIGSKAFWLCYNLTDITLPEGVTSIGDNAFSGCESLTSITLPEGVTEIGDWAFSGCVSLTSVTLLESVTGACKNALDYDTLKSVIAPGVPLSVIPTEGRIAAAVGYADARERGISYPPENDAAYKKYIKSQRKRLYSAALSSLPLLRLMLAEKMIPEADVQPLVEQSRAYGVEQTAVLQNYQNETPAKSKKKAPLVAFSLNTGVVLTVTEAKESWNYKKTEDGGLRITGYKGPQTDVTVPKQIGKDKVTEIGECAFSPNTDRLSDAVREYRRKIQSVSLPEGVTSIGDKAFYNCKSLTSITLPEGVTSIGDRAFKGCKGLADKQGMVIIRGVLYSYHGSGGDVAVPDGVTSIGDEAFWGCTSLTSITLPDGVTEIGWWAFEDCKSLTSITLPDGVTSIGDRAFDGCTSLTIHAPAGSYAEKYAKENKIRFEATE